MHDLEAVVAGEVVVVAVEAGGVEGDGGVALAVALERLDLFAAVEPALVRRLALRDRGHERGFEGAVFFFGVG